MRKRLCPLWALALLFALTACGGGSFPTAASPAATAAPSSAPEPSQSQAAEEQAAPMPPFTTVDLEGSEVTEAIFADKALTVVNVWGTFCGPCISEMPDLGSWAREMPENVQLIGIICDLPVQGAEETRELAQSILEQADADFTCLALSDDLAWLSYAVSGVPTTFFVDGQGNIVGGVVVGAYVDAYKAQVEELLDEMAQ